MPFPRFWRRSSSYNVKHDYDGVNKPPKSVSISRITVPIDEKEEITHRRRTVLKPKYINPGKSIESLQNTTLNSTESIFVEEKSLQDEDTNCIDKTIDPGKQEQIDKANSETRSPVTIIIEQVKDEIEETVEVEVDDQENNKRNTFEITRKSTNDEGSNYIDKAIDPGKQEQTDKANSETRSPVTIIIDSVESEIVQVEDQKNNKRNTFEITRKSTNDEVLNFNDKTIGLGKQEQTDKANSETRSSITIIIEPVKYEIEETMKIEAEDQRNKEVLLEVDATISRSSSVENTERFSVDSTLSFTKSSDEKGDQVRRRSGVQPTPIRFDEDVVKNLVKYPKSESDEKCIKDAICKNEFLSKVITGGRLQDVVDAMYIKEVKAKEKIIKEGQRGGHMYVAAEGEFEVTKKGKGVVNVMKPGEVFGELAILYNAKRFATVRPVTSAKVWVIDGTVYQQLVKKSMNEEQEELVSFLQNVPILNEAGSEVLKNVAGLLKPEFFETGTTIVREGDRGDKFYIITAGSVTVTQENNGFIGQLHKGKCFGEKALLEPVTRQATIKADDPGTECLTLTQKHFVDNFGKIEDISKITMPSQPKVPIADVKKIVNEYSHLDLSEFKILKTLGVGGFGRVEFIKHKKDPSLTFALKCLKKYEMVQQEQQYHVINEMMIQMTCNSPFIIRLYKTFKDNKFIYFLMEVCLGGDLWSLLQRQPNKNFTETGARFIAGCVLEALAYLHERGFVYRDLKPENLLIDNKGYVKMTDFGFAKSLTPGCKSGTFAGTPEYLAPEVILNRGHDKAVDLWAYGIFVYELLNGKTPFRTNDPSYMKTYNNILNGLDVVFFPVHNSAKAKNLICKLLKKSPSERLGIEDIRTHKWFSEFDWERLRSCQMSSPYRPKLSSNVDCRYIDHFRRDNDIPPDENSWWDEYF